MSRQPKEILDENVIKRLDADDPSNRDLAEGIKLIMRMLWSEDRLNEIIERKHREMCETCQYKVVDKENEPVGCELTRRHVIVEIVKFLVEIVKSPWFWLVAATACAIVCAKYGISLPVVGGGQ